ncbi:MAG: hypothetical protein ACKVLM_16085 [Pseudomonadales bacterium]
MTVLLGRLIHGYRPQWLRQQVTRRPLHSNRNVPLSQVNPRDRRPGIAGGVPLAPTGTFG